MYTHKTRRFWILTGLLWFSKADAQYITQLGVSNYGPVHSYYVNPSFNAYSAYKWQVNLVGLWANANNNFLTLKMPYSLYRLPNRVPSQYLTESGNPAFDKNWLNETLNGRPKHAAVSSDVYGPSAYIKIRSWNLGILTQSSASVRVASMPENLAHAIFKELDSSQGAYRNFTSGNNKINQFTVTGNARMSVGLNVSKSIDLDYDRKLLLGVTVKKVWGMPGFYFNNTGISIRSVNQDSMVIDPTRIQLVSYGDQWGKGWGTDIGATYVFNKKDFKRHGEYAKNITRYFCKLGFAILDIGRINYKNARFNEASIDQPVGIGLNSSRNYPVPSSGNYQSLADSFMNEFGSYRSYNGNYSVGLPTRMVLSADFQLRKRLFLATVATQSLRHRLSKHARYQSFLMVSPRWEYRFFEFSLPVMLEYDYRAVRMGMSVRLGPLYFGTNSLGSFLYTRSFRDADMFIGIAFGNLSDLSFRKLARKKRHGRENFNQACENF